MSKSFFNLSNFIATVNTTSLARTNRFEVLINAPPCATRGNEQLVSLYTEQINFPPIINNLRSYKVWGPSIHRPQSIEYGGEGINAIFHVDRDMSVKKFFDDWMHGIIDKNNFTVSYLKDYATTIDINQLDEQNNITYSVKLFDAFPRSMNVMELNNASQNQTHRLSVVFAYRYWFELPDSRQSADVPPNLLNPEVPVSDIRQGSTTTTTVNKTPTINRQFNSNPYSGTGNLEENISGSDLPISA